jgi:hypothetical protein
MASEVRFRVPVAMRHFFRNMLSILRISELFPNVTATDQGRREFLRETSALWVQDRTGESRPVADAVIFTGTPAHAAQLRKVYDRRTLFIANGAGHNPVVVAPDADLADAVRAVISLQFYNQGQDCAAPSSILVHRDVFAEFRSGVVREVKQLRVGPYKDRTCQVGPLTDPRDLVRVQEFLVKHRPWIDPVTPGSIHTAASLVEPTVVCKPLPEGGSYAELFAPIILLQEYADDSSLALYFEHPQYAPNAMYVTLYGSSDYVEGLIDVPLQGRVLHRNDTILRNTHLHAEGVERGTQPYGGYGSGASTLSIGGTVVCKPTLPQRDLWEWRARPLTEPSQAAAYWAFFETKRIIRYRDLHKLLRLNDSEEAEDPKRSPAGELPSAHTAPPQHGGVHPELLAGRNKQFLSGLSPDLRQIIRNVRELVSTRSIHTEEQFSDALYELLRGSSPPRDVFQALYQLLFGTSCGPRLPSFLFRADREQLCTLLEM